MLRAFRQKAFHQFQTEGQRLTHQIRIIVGSKSSSTAGEGIAQFVDRNFLDGASSSRSRERQDQND
jgi:hypothetical protein